MRKGTLAIGHFEDFDERRAFKMDPLLNEGGGGLHPDHPLLARAQEALKKQLLANKKRLEDEYREKQNELKARPSNRLRGTQ